MEYEQQLEILLRLGRVISKENNLDRLLQVTGNFSAEIVDAERCSIFIYDKQNNLLTTKVSHGLNGIQIPADKGVVGSAIQTGEVQISTDPYHDIRFLPMIDEQSGYKTRSLLVVPMFDSQNEVLGAIELVNKRKGLFSNFDAELIILIANYASAAVESAVLHEKIRTTQSSLIYKLSTAAEFKDDETSAHTKRVAHYTGLIAQELELSSREIMP